MAGPRGPVPNRSSDLSRDRDANRGDRAPITKGVSRPAVIPEPNAEWHSVARMLWDAVLISGQVDFYESSDYAYLYLVCDELSAYKLMTGRRSHSAMMFAALNQAFERLLITEGDRRRVRLELQDADDTEDAEIEDYAEDFEKKLRLVV